MGLNRIRAALVRVAVAMPPGPVFLLLCRRELAKIAVRIAMIFVRPLVLIDHLVLIPDVIVAVVGIIDAVVMMFRTSSN
jgi:hypothetical protein